MAIKCHTSGELNSNLSYHIIPTKLPLGHVNMFLYVSGYDLMKEYTENLEIWSVRQTLFY